MAIAASIDYLHHFIGYRTSCQADIQIAANISSRKHIQANFAAECSHAELVADPRYGVRAMGDVERSVASNYQQASLICSARKQGQYVNCGVITPVQILQDEHHRYVRGECLEKFAEFS